MLGISVWCALGTCWASLCDVPWGRAGHLCVMCPGDLLGISVWCALGMCWASLCDVPWGRAGHLCVMCPGDVLGISVWCALGMCWASLWVDPWEPSPLPRKRRTLVSYIFIQVNRRPSQILPSLGVHLYLFYGIFTSQQCTLEIQNTG
jgi:hypothetical protein